MLEQGKKITRSKISKAPEPQKPETKQVDKKPKQTKVGVKRKIKQKDSEESESESKPKQEEKRDFKRPKVKETVAPKAEVKKPEKQEPEI